ncbi:hypothetical protein E3P99_03512 [Wallemia hederae]|uniref:Late endosomal/lysosomal adaptor and MAPK and MTOR activator 5 n=1 Tax=Wallemia hederae TaxID=1540922 RepID=A0A4T0FFX9_9BASI|nr:hypothetical protein E3P99_03512 [Wallemia hederae]
MHGDLLSLDDAASVLHQLSTQFGDIDGVLVLDKTQFCIGANGSLKESDASVVAQLTDNVCTTPNNVYKIHLSDNRGFLYLLNNETITLAILKSQ